MADDELALRRAADRMARAEALLRNETLIEAFDELRKTYMHGWEMTAARDVEGREKFWVAITVLNRVKEDLNRVITDGKIALSQLAAIAIEEERNKRF